MLELLLKGGNEEKQNDERGPGGKPVCRMWTKSKSCRWGFGCKFEHVDEVNGVRVCVNQGGVPNAGLQMAPLAPTMQPQGMMAGVQAGQQVVMAAQANGVVALTNVKEEAPKELALTTMQKLNNRPLNFMAKSATDKDFFQAVYQDTNVNGERLMTRDTNGDLVFRCGPVIAMYFERFVRIMRRVHPDATKNGEVIGQKKSNKIMDLIEEGIDDLQIEGIPDTGKLLMLADQETTTAKTEAAEKEETALMGFLKDVKDELKENRKAMADLAKEKTGSSAGSVNSDGSPLSKGPSPMRKKPRGEGGANSDPEGRGGHHRRSLFATAAETNPFGKNPFGKSAIERTPTKMRGMTARMFGNEGHASDTEVEELSRFMQQGKNDLEEQRRRWEMQRAQDDDNARKELDMEKRRLDLEKQAFDLETKKQAAKAEALKEKAQRQEELRTQLEEMQRNGADVNKDAMMKMKQEKQEAEERALKLEQEVLEREQNARKVVSEREEALLARMAVLEQQRTDEIAAKQAQLDQKERELESQRRLIAKGKGKGEHGGAAADTGAEAGGGGRGAMPPPTGAPARDAGGAARAAAAAATTSSGTTSAGAATTRGAQAAAGVATAAPRARAPSGMATAAGAGGEELGDGGNPFAVPAGRMGGEARSPAEVFKEQKMEKQKQKAAAAAQARQNLPSMGKGPTSDEDRAKALLMMADQRKRNQDVDEQIKFANEEQVQAVMETKKKMMNKFAELEEECFSSCPRRGPSCKEYIPLHEDGPLVGLQREWLGSGPSMATKEMVPIVSDLIIDFGMYFSIKEHKDALDLMPEVTKLWTCVQQPPKRLGAILNTYDCDWRDGSWAARAAMVVTLSLVMARRNLKDKVMLRKEKLGVILPATKRGTTKVLGGVTPAAGMATSMAGSSSDVGRVARAASPLRRPSLGRMNAMAAEMSGRPKRAGGIFAGALEEDTDNSGDDFGECEG